MVEQRQQVGRRDAPRSPRPTPPPHPAPPGRPAPCPRSDAWSAASSTPGDGAIRASSPSSPTTTIVGQRLGIDHAHRAEQRRARSAGRNAMPSLGRSAGDRLTTIRLGGSARPIAAIAPRTRSRLSATALSASPTTLKPGSPGISCTCTSTARASSPRYATVDTLATMHPPAVSADFANSSAARVLQHHRPHRRKSTPGSPSSRRLLDRAAPIGRSRDRADLLFAAGCADLQSHWAASFAR